MCIRDRIGTAAAALSAFSPTGAGLLIRFTGPELWWLLTVAHRIAAVPGASVTVPSGVAGMAWVTVVSIVAILSWRRRWGRMLSVGAACCLLAWTLSGVVAAA